MEGWWVEYSIEFCFAENRYGLEFAACRGVREIGLSGGNGEREQGE